LDSHRSNKGENMDAEQIAQILTTPVTKSKDVTTSILNNAADQQNRLVQALQIEQKRAAALRGANSTQAKQAQVLLVSHQQSLTRIQATAASAKAPVPLANSKEFIIYGIVRGKSGQPVAGIEVSAVDAKGTVYGTVASGSDGSYALHLQTAVPTPVEKAQVAVVVPASAAAPQVPLTASLSATDAKKTFLVHSDVTFQVTPGQLAYQDLTVPV
jgi:uncharacterized protein YfaS (alpha-2-macroglobulin family)